MRIPGIATALLALMVSSTLIFAAAQPCGLALLSAFQAPAQTGSEIGQRRQIRTKNAVVEVVEHGTGETIVLLPGYGGVFSFRGLVLVLAESGYRCVVVDRRLTSAATGDSITGITLQEYAVQLGQVIEALGRVPVHVIGHTGGAFAGAMLASEFPEIVKSLVIMPAGLTTWPLPPQSAQIQQATRKQRAIRIIDEKTFEEACGLMRTMLFSPSTPEAAVHEYITGLLKEFKAPDGSIYRAWGDRRPPWDMVATAPGKWIEGGTAPVLGVHGLDDRTVPPELGRIWQKKLGDRARLVELPNAGHVLMVEQPHAVAKAVLSFYQNLSSQSGSTRGTIPIEMAERLAPEGRVPFHGFDLDRRPPAIVPLDVREGWAKLTRHPDRIEVLCRIRGMQQGRIYQPRIVGWNNPSACKGDSRYGSVSCSQLVDDTDNNPDADQFHVSFRGIVADQTGEAALRLQLKIGEGLPPMRNAFARPLRDTNVFWGSHFKGNGLTNPMGGEFFVLIVDKDRPSSSDLEDHLRGPLYGCKSEPGTGGPQNCLFWRRSFVGAIPRK